MTSRSRRTGAPLSQQEFFILCVLADSHKHGYAVGKQVEELTEGTIVFSAATLYQNLNQLERAGLVSLDEDLFSLEGGAVVAPGKARKTYTITPSGAAALEAQLRLYQRAANLVRRRHSCTT